MKKIINYFILITSLALTSCEDVIQVKLDEGQKLLVVDAFLNDLRTNQVVKLSYTDSYFSGVNPPPITNGTVVLKDLTTNVSYNFSNAGNGEYVFTINPTDTIARLNHAYQLEVNYDGNIYYSTAFQKRTTPIDSIQAEFQEETSFQKEGYDCKMWARDAVGPIIDYYWVKSYRNGILFNKGSQINLAVDGANGAGADGFIFSPPIANGITPRGEVFKLNDVCRVEIHSISEETFRFLSQVISQTTNSGLFATTPENVKTNIITPANAKTKAIGWFNMASVSYREKIVK